MLETLIIFKFRWGEKNRRRGSAGRNGAQRERERDEKRWKGKSSLSILLFFLFFLSFCASKFFHFAQPISINMFLAFFNLPLHIYFIFISILLFCPSAVLNICTLPHRYALYIVLKVTTKSFAQVQKCRKISFWRPYWNWDKNKIDNYNL